MATPESKVKARAKKVLDKMGAYYFFPMTGGFGHSGIPDIIACVTGLFVGIECKAGKGKTTALQDQQLKLIKESGGFSIVVNETNVDNLEELITSWRHTAKTET